MKIYSYKAFGLAVDMQDWLNQSSLAPANIIYIVYNSLSCDYVLFYWTEQ